MFQPIKLFKCQSDISYNAIINGFFVQVVAD